MHIAILGGSFDPPHRGHLLLAEQIQKAFPIDEVWLIPCYQHPFRKELSPAKHRLHMTKLLAADTIKVSDIEIKREHISYSIDTLLSVKERFPEDTFSWIIGSDQIADFPKWKDWQKIINDFGLIIYPRNTDISTISAMITEAFAMQKIADTIFYPKQPLQTSSISSTAIRNRVKNNQSITGLVTPKVATYIMKQRLYE